MLSSEVSSNGSPSIIEPIRIRRATPSISSNNDMDDCAINENLRIVEITDEVTNTPRDLSTPEKHIIANDILNDILETAMDIAVGVETPTKLKRSKMNIIDDDDRSTDGNQLIEINDGLSKVKLEGLSRKNSTNSVMNVGMKRVLTEIMSASSTPRPDTNLGIGDSAPLCEEHPAVIVKPSKPLEKKTRITDLVMNSKKVLRSMLNEEQRRKRDEWEEANEHFIQLIELEKNQADVDMLAPETCPLPVDEDDADLLLMPKDTSQLDNIELCAEESVAGNSVGGKGDEKKSKDSKSTLHRKSSLCSGGSKRRKWLSGLKVFSFFRNRKNGKGKGDKTEENLGEQVNN